jgi:acyl-CoA synthetase (AMP-forming)/AMP-acid ligase II
MTKNEEQREALRRRWRELGVYSELTVGTALAQGAAAHPDDAIVFAAVDGATDQATLASLHAGGRRLAAALHRIGVRPGEAVAVQAPADRTSTELIEALWLLGTVVVPLVAAYGPAEIGHIVQESGATTYVSPASWRGVEHAARAVEHASSWGLKHVVTLGGNAPPGAVALTAVPGDVEVPRAVPAPADVCCILYTSGSTAAPKGAQHSHETLLAGVTAVPADPSTRTLATFPAGHIASLLGLLRPLAVGGTTVVMDRWSARRAAELIEEHALTFGSGTPFFLAGLLDQAERAGRDVSTLRTFLCGAASVPPSLVARAAAHGIVSWRTYGATEHPAISTGVADDPVDKRMHTDGRVTPGNEVRLVDALGNDVPAGEEGEILSRGPKQFLGYRDASLDGDAFLGSWFRTGDLGRFDDDGYLIVTDRVKDIIIRGGENISAREVEDALAGHPGVEEVAVCAAPDDTWGERVCAFVRPAPGPPPTLEALAQHVAAAGLAAHKAPAQLVVLDDFPRTSAGKIRKQDLRASLR